MKMNIGKVLMGAAMLVGLTTPAIAQDWDRDNRFEERWDDDRRFDRDDWRNDGNWRDERGWRGDDRRVDRLQRAIETRVFQDRELRRQAFRYFDRNRDGRMNWNERRQTTRYFTRVADINRDGFVSGSEFRRARARLLDRVYASRW